MRIEGGTQLISDRVAGQIGRKRILLNSQQEVESYVRYFGPKTRNAREVFDYAWDNDTIARGAPIGFTPPGALISYGEALRRPVGPIHWAGTETTTVWNGYMDGAVQSGEQVAEEVLAAL